MRRRMTNLIQWKMIVDLIRGEKKSLINIYVCYIFGWNNNNNGYINLLLLLVINTLLPCIQGINWEKKMRIRKYMYLCYIIYCKRKRK